MIFKGAWFIKLKKCIHKITLELNMKNKIGKGGLAPAGICFLRRKKKFGKNFRVRIHTEDCSM